MFCASVIDHCTRPSVPDRIIALVPQVSQTSCTLLLIFILILIVMAPFSLSLSLSLLLLYNLQIIFLFLNVFLHLTSFTCTSTYSCIALSPPLLPPLPLTPFLPPSLPLSLSLNCLGVSHPHSSRLCSLLFIVPALRGRNRYWYVLPFSYSTNTFVTSHGHPYLLAALSCSSSTFLFLPTCSSLFYLVFYFIML